VSLPGLVASLGDLHVEFYKLRNGGFSPSTYSRRDAKAPDVRRDWALIEDAIFCIAQEFRKCARRTEALEAVATAVRANAHIFGACGPDRLTAPQRVERQRAIEAGAARIEVLAERNATGENTTSGRPRRGTITTLPSSICEDSP